MWYLMPCCAVQTDVTLMKCPLCYVGTEAVIAKLVDAEQIAECASTIVCTRLRPESQSLKHNQIDPNVVPGESQEETARFYGCRLTLCIEAMPNLSKAEPGCTNNVTSTVRSYTASIASAQSRVMSLTPHCCWQIGQ